MPRKLSWLDTALVINYEVMFCAPWMKPNQRASVVFVAMKRNHYYERPWELNVNNKQDIWREAKVLPSSEITTSDQ